MGGDGGGMGGRDNSGRGEGGVIRNWRKRRREEEGKENGEASSEEGEKMC